MREPKSGCLEGIVLNDDARIESERSAIPLILGTAGHIDHGKTSLIRYLTGKDTDRLPEEKKRGITIELGFAHLPLPPFDFGIVDVPGHEKFVRTMLSGASGFDVVLLVIAADDSINQQTREHLEILNFLEIPAGVVALTKCDRVDSDWIDLVEEEVRDLLGASVLKDAAIVRTSSQTGLGMDELKAKLIEAGHRAQAERESLMDAPFRMPVDRVFSVDGQGTVVTGSVTHGSLSVGEEVDVVPGPHQSIRVRQIQSHDQNATRVVRGQRAAINLAGPRVEDLSRGDLLVSPGSLKGSRCLTVRVKWLPEFRARIKNHQLVRLHVGTDDEVGQFRLLDKASAGDETGVWAQLILKNDVAVAWGQPIVLRQVSPVRTIGMALVGASHIQRQHRWTRADLSMVEKLISPQPCTRLEAAAYFDRSGRQDYAHLAKQMEVSLDDLTRCLEADCWQIYRTGNQELRFHRERLDQFSIQLKRKLTALHDQLPQRWVFPIEKVASQMSYLEPIVLEGLLREAERAGWLRTTPRGIGLMDRGPQLTRNQQKRYEWILETFLQAELSPPTVKQCVEMADKNKQDVPDLVRMALDSGDLVGVTSEILLSEEVLTRAWHDVQQLMADGRGYSVAEIRDQLGTSRKMTVPLCEFWDRQKLLRREGDLRFLV